MSIKTDAYSLLKFIVEKRKTNSTEIISFFKFDEDRTFDALKYLEQKYYITVEGKSLGGVWHLIGATADGIDFNEVLEKQEKKEIGQKDIKIDEHSKKEITDQISRIEKGLNFLLSRKNRETMYRSILYPLIFSTFIAIGFSSFVELLKFLIPQKYQFFLYLMFYFLILISILAVSMVYDVMRKNLEIDDYFATFKIKNNVDIFDLTTKLRKIFENTEHQFNKLIPEFEGIFYLNDMIFWMRYKGVDVEKKECILKEDYNKILKLLIYDFKSVSSRNVLSILEIDFKDFKIKFNIDKGTGIDIANKVYRNFLSLNELEPIEKSGWDY